MADFCWDCFPGTFGFPADKNDLAQISEPDNLVSAICEGCGPGWFDYSGKKVSFDDGKDEDGR